MESYRIDVHSYTVPNKFEVDGSPRLVYHCEEFDVVNAESVENAIACVCSYVDRTYTNGDIISGVRDLHLRYNGKDYKYSGVNEQYQEV